MPEPQGLDLETRALSQFAPQGYYIGLHIRFTSPMIVLASYPKDWTDHYTAQAYALRDPIVAWGFSTEGMTRWSDIALPDTFGILEEAKSFGLAYGVTVSAGPMTSRTIGSVARADREFSDDEMAEVQSIIQRMHAVTQPPEGLTDAQVEALRLVANGMRHSEAATHLGISHSALKARLTSARHKLMARTTLEAIQRAKEYRFL